MAQSPTTGLQPIRYAPCAKGCADCVCCELAVSRFSILNIHDIHGTSDTDNREPISCILTAGTCIMCISVQVDPLEPPLVTGEGSKMDESGSGFAWRPGKDKLEPQVVSKVCLRFP